MDQGEVISNYNAFLLAKQCSVTSYLEYTTRDRLPVIVTVFTKFINLP